MVAYEANRNRRTVRDVSTRSTEVHGVRVFDSWTDDDLDGSIDQISPLARPAPTVTRSVVVPERPREPSLLMGLLRSLVMMTFGGVLGVSIVSVVLAGLFVVGGVAAAVALVYTVPIVDVVAPPRALPKTNPDADLVVMPDPGFREKPEQKPGEKPKKR